MTRFTELLKSHSFRDYFSADNQEYSRFVLRLFELLLSEDMGSRGDISSVPLIDERLRGKAIVVAKSVGLVSGLYEIGLFLSSCEEVTVNFLLNDGDEFCEGDILFEIEGNVREILLLERTLLNFLQRMCGIATYTREFLTVMKMSFRENDAENSGADEDEKVAGMPLLCPTRKTFWGAVDKKACLIGGAGTHRINLSDAVMVKDNHIVALSDDFERVFDVVSREGRFLEIEASGIHMAERIIETYVANSNNLITGRLAPRNLYLLLDNLPPKELKEGICIFKNKFDCTNIFFEASGGVNLSNIGAYSNTGVDIISVGALTHSAPVADLSMKLVEVWAPM